MQKHTYAFSRDIEVICTATPKNGDKKGYIKLFVSMYRYNNTNS